MLVLSRKIGERLIIGDDIVLTVNRIRDGSVTLGIEAPKRIGIRRGELSPFAGPNEDGDDEEDEPSDVVLDEDNDE